jgi:hypothetical protein
MPAFTVPIHERNDCHTPAGSPAGGQFCSKTETGLAAGFATLRKELLHRSFGIPDQPARETLWVMDSTGQTVGGVFEGNRDSVHISREDQETWHEHGRAHNWTRPLTVAHTHPNGSAFSWEDLAFANVHNGHVQVKPGSLPRGASAPLSINRMIVFDRQGHWHELVLKQFISPGDLAHIRSDYFAERDVVRVHAMDKVTNAVAARFKVPAFESRIMELVSLGKITQDDLDDELNVHYAPTSHKIWERLAASHKYGAFFSYRRGTGVADAD